MGQVWQLVAGDRTHDDPTAEQAPIDLGAIADAHRHECPGHVNSLQPGQRGRRQAVGDGVKHPRQPLQIKLRDAERPGRETVRAAGRWLAEQPGQRPLFLWVHLFDPHEPYEPPVAFLTGEPGTTAAYAGEVAYADSVTGSLLTLIEEHVDELVASDPGLSQIQDDMVGVQRGGIISTGDAARIHPGLARYLRERDAWDEAWDDRVAD